MISNNNNHVIYLYEYLFVKYIYNSSYISNLLPFNIYKNLLISCFPTHESFIKFIKSDYRKNDDEDVKIDRCLKNFVSILLNNSVHIHLHDFISMVSVNEEIILLKASAIKCIFILTGSKRYIHILSHMKQFIEIDLTKAIYANIPMKK
ncbi:LOW QUALITY PROTEIN: hypothetical protein HZS_6244 [Henneguya salminicola]|nr:LOW QUALITY PROTEIN: hypothetical protein HZS_6244 [Henneguya salminicola]